MNWFLMALKKYAQFTGRSQRSEFWFFMLFFTILLIVLSIFDNMVFGGADGTPGTPILTLLACAGLLVPSIAVAIRRLHDTERSGWWYLIQLVPIVGPIMLIVFCAQDSKAGANAYGPNPKGVA